MIVVCPYCNRAHTAHTSLTEAARPAEGDVSLCIVCGQLGVFTAAGWVRKPSPEESARFNALPEIQKARAAWRKVVAQ